MRVDEHTFHLDDSPVYYRSADASGMPKLYLHGIPTSSDDWFELLARTGGVAPDLIGFGRSGKGGHLDYSLGGLANFIERFLMHIGIDKVQIVGHDWGAALALVLYRRQVGRVRRLILINPPPLLDDVGWPRVMRLWRTRVVGELIMGATTQRLLGRTLQRGSRRADAWSEERIAAVWRQFDQGTQRAILRLVRSAGDDVIGDSGPRPPRRGTADAGACAGAAGARATVTGATDAGGAGAEIADAGAAGAAATI
ncbi:MAG: alpha/beta fold hydrolase, partial [Solirubrobacterales bacterium]|nr:alpha/beta fold hydrolase [Solirubrobacterales bacterium]